MIENEASTKKQDPENSNNSKIYFETIISLFYIFIGVVAPILFVIFIGLFIGELSLKEEFKKGSFLLFSASFVASSLYFSKIVSIPQTLNAFSKIDFYLKFLLYFLSFLIALLYSVVYLKEAGKLILLEEQIKIVNENITSISLICFVLSFLILIRMNYLSVKLSNPIDVGKNSKDEVDNMIKKMGEENSTSTFKVEIK